MIILEVFVDLAKNYVEALSSYNPSHLCIRRKIFKILRWSTHDTITLTFSPLHLPGHYQLFNEYLKLKERSDIDSVTPRDTSIT